MSQIISKEALLRLVDGWIGRGKKVAGPSRVKSDLVLYKYLAASGQLLLEPFLRPANSIKETVFPAHEKLYGYRVKGRQIELFDLEPPAAEQMVIGARPCDAASLPILDNIFNWDTEDTFYTRRRKLTTVVTLACREHDAHCFCTSVGLGPEDDRGSDAMLLDLGDGRYEVRTFTEKGKALFAGHTEASQQTARKAKGPEKHVDLEMVRSFLATGFESPVWNTLGMRCVGCGACAFTCPTCHCFDIVDEGNAAGGVRARNWDTCQSGLFTHHASGHNPRSVQAQRQRQRVFHKFQIYPDKFGETLCTGCGNCTRNCPVSLGIPAALELIRLTAAPLVETVPSQPRPEVQRVPASKAAVAKE